MGYIFILDIYGGNDLVKAVVNAMVAYNIIHPSMKEYYEYALEVSVERLITLTSMAIIALCMGKMIPGILFLSFFLFLRRHTGGYHAKTFFSCYIESIVIYVAVLIFGEGLIHNMVTTYVALGVSFIIIMLIGTVNHPNMNFSALELRESKQSARYVLILEMIIILSLNVIGAAKQYIGFMILGIVLCAVSVIISKIIKQEVSK